MELSGEHRLAAPRERVWDALNDPQVLARCIPGCEELARSEDGGFRGRVRAAIGPVQAMFATKLQIREPRPPASYRLEGEGQAGAAGFGKGAADVELLEEQDCTLLRYRAELKVGGRLAQVGSRLVVGASQKIASEFFERFAAQFPSPAEPALPAQESIPVEPASQSSGNSAEGGPGARRGSRLMFVLLAVAALAIIVWFSLR